MVDLNHLTAQQVIALARRELAKRRMIRFAEYIKPNWISMAHHEMIANALDRLRLHENERLIISMPPRHGKSELSSILFPALYLADHPDHQIIHISYASSLSNEFSRQVRAYIRDNPSYRSLFPHVQLDPDRQRLDDWKTVQGGGFKSVGTGGGISGHGAHLIIIDDPVKEGDERSPATLQQIYEWYSSAARTRLAPGGNIVIIMTRWHPLDLVGRLLKLAETDPNAEQWQTLVLPALAEAGDPLGREAGAALWPERFSRGDLLRLKALSGRYFDALYQQQPRSEEEQLFFADRFKRFVVGHPPFAAARGAWCFDLALSEKDSADYSAFARVLWDTATRSLAIEHPRRRRREWPRMKKLILKLMELYPDDVFVFPRQTYELMAVQEIRSERPEDAGRVVQVSLPGDKRERATVLADAAASGRVWLQAGRYGDSMLDEHVQFPAGEFDDQVDVTSVATHHLGLAGEFMALVRREDDAPNDPYERLADAFAGA